MGKTVHPPYQVITLESVDRAIYEWFDHTLGAHVETPSGDRKKVLVNFSSGERFATSRERKGFRDKDGRLVLPVISLNRTSINPDQSMEALGIQTPRMQVARKISGKSNAIENLERTRTPNFRSKQTIYEVTTIPFPNRSIIVYEFSVQAQYMTQLNSILEKFFHELDIQRSFIAELDQHREHTPNGVPFKERFPEDRHYVVAFMKEDVGDSSNFEEFTDQERIVSFTTNIQVPITLHLDPEGERPAVQIEKTSFGLGFGDEHVHFVDDPREMDKIFGMRR